MALFWCFFSWTLTTSRHRQLYREQFCLRSSFVLLLVGSWHPNFCENSMNSNIYSAAAYHCSAHFHLLYVELSEAESLKLKCVVKSNL